MESKLEKKIVLFLSLSLNNSLSALLYDYTYKSNESFYKVSFKINV